MTFIDCLSLSKFNFTQNLSGGKMVKFQHSQALTSHFESFWSIVHRKPYLVIIVDTDTWFPPGASGGLTSGFCDAIDHG